jgi:predicted DNA-binding protein
MTLRLSDDLDQRLSDQAQRTGLSKQKIAVLAIEAHLDRASQSTLAQDVIDKVLARDKELLERLASA